ncbi:MAG TPA: outer membrane lipoprotein carrier protein LolA [Candidatus Acidoferrales bacterium]|nr:outer membrane lipoprotein carrier protein LolA [Candidatus Acidoferrales bacterium]
MNEEATQPAAQDVRAVVRTLESHYHSASTLEATFLERYSEGGRVVRVESGIVYFRRPGRMRWQYDSPEEKLFLADGKNVWFYVPADRTVTRARMSESTDWRTPLAVLTGRARLARLCSRIEFTDEFRPAAGRVVLRCQPRGEAAPTKGRGAALREAEEPRGFHEVFLEVDPQSGELARVVIRQSAGVELDFRFGNWQENLALPETMFRFQPPVGVAIVEESAVGRPSP